MLKSDVEFRLGGHRRHEGLPWQVGMDLHFWNFYERIGNGTIINGRYVITTEEFWHRLPIDYCPSQPRWVGVPFGSENKNTLSGPVFF